MTGGQAAPDAQCPVGYYCPNGTVFGTEFACPNGTYNDLLGMAAVTDCKDCTQGQ